MISSISWIRPGAILGVCCRFGGGAVLSLRRFVPSGDVVTSRAGDMQDAI